MKKLLLLALLTTLRFTSSDNLPEERNHMLYITVDHGICLDDEGNGRVLTTDTDHDYISYCNTKAVTGDHVITFCVMNPANDYCDDVLVRYDIIH